VMQHRRSGRQIASTVAVGSLGPFRVLDHAGVIDSRTYCCALSKTRAKENEHQKIYKQPISEMQIQSTAVEEMTCNGCTKP
jgi:hypothetical protein